MKRSNTYRNIYYTVTVNLNAVVENLKPIHIVTCESGNMGDRKYFKQYETEPTDLEDTILKSERDFVTWVDTTTNKEELLLLKLGFEHEN